MHSPLTCIQHKAMQLMRQLVEAHDMDPRLANDKSARTRIAYLYFPLLNLIVHFLPFMISTLPLKSMMATRPSSSDGELSPAENNNSGSDFDSFLAEMSLGDERRIDECCWYLSDLVTTTPPPTTTTTSSTDCCFDIIDDYYFDDYDINFLIDSSTSSHHRLVDDADPAMFFSLYPMFDNFKLEDDLVESNDEILGYINRYCRKSLHMYYYNNYTFTFLFCFKVISISNK